MVRGELTQGAACVVAAHPDGHEIYNETFSGAFDVMREVSGTDKSLITVKAPGNPSYQGSIVTSVRC